MPEFNWCDLSTFDIEAACKFYGAVAGWSHHESDAKGGNGDYRVFYSADRSAAGVYTMPEFFQSIQMPSFWMSYVRVNSIASVYERAGQLGAKCEIPPTAFDEQSSFALVRDPSGAGFTLYEGPELMEMDNRSAPRIELHVDSVDAIKAFYEELFGWSIVSDRRLDGRYGISSASNSSIASILELDSAVKGPKNYWSVVFHVKRVADVERSVPAHGGRVLMEYDASIGYAMLEDDQGAMFCVSESIAG